MALNVHAKAYLQVPIDKVDKLIASVRALQENAVLVGVPATEAGRLDDDGKPATINNAMIAYLMEHGIPSQNVPARPFLVPGILAIRDQVSNQMIRAARFALEGEREMVIKQFHATGLTAQNSIRNVIRQGIPPPLSEVTLYKRVHRNTTTGRAGSRKGAMKELANRAAGIAPSTDFAKPLYDTGALLKSITYVLRGRWFDG